MISSDTCEERTEVNFSTATFGTHFICVPQRVAVLTLVAIEARRQIALVVALRVERSAQLHETNSAQQTVQSNANRPVGFPR